MAVPVNDAGRVGLLHLATVGQLARHGERLESPGRKGTWQATRSKRPSGEVSASEVPVVKSWLEMGG